MTIRPAKPADAAAIARIWNHYIRATLATFNSVEKTGDEVAGLIRARGEDGRAFLVWDEAGEIRGFATYFQFRGGAGYARTAEHTIQLAPGAEGRGAGRALMTAIEDHARGTGHHVLYAGISSGNPAGEAFHARLGYVEEARLAEVGWKNGCWWDLILMRKVL